MATMAASSSSLTNLTTLTSSMARIRLATTPPTSSCLSQQTRQISYRMKKHKGHTPSTMALVTRLTEKTPTYPYPIPRFYKQQNLGLYGGLKLRAGNNVSDRTKSTTRRVWRPNIHRKKLWSEGLGRFVRMKVATRVLRTIDKCGGLDSYLLGEKAGRVRELGVFGWVLRWRVMQTPLVQAKFQKEREALKAIYGFELENPLARVPKQLLLEDGEIRDENEEIISAVQRDRKIGAIDRQLDLDDAEAAREEEELAKQAVEEDVSGMTKVSGLVLDGNKFMEEEAAPKRPNA